MKTGQTWALGVKQSWGISLQVVNKQPKTHSGKTVRHLLRDMALKLEDQHDACKKTLSEQNTVVVEEYIKKLN